VWSAGHAVGSVDRVTSVADVVAELEHDYRRAFAELREHTAATTGVNVNT
jgi:nitronate monooxygenase